MSAGLARRAAGSMLRLANRLPLANLALLPYFRARHRALLRVADRSNAHTYTSFYRSPAQLDALCGPVLEHLLGARRGPLSILVFAGSTGAEAYTLASELSFRYPDLDFGIHASDLHAETVAKAQSATYTLAEITQGLEVPRDFIERTFDRNGEDYLVKPHIRARVRFETADLLAPGLGARFQPADIVVAQNVLFHMPEAMARRAFAQVLAVLRPGGVLFIDGMELDMRVELTRRAGLRPLDYRVREIYQYSRRHIPENWWDIYYGNEPYSPLATERLRRYATIFFNA